MLSDLISWYVVIGNGHCTAWHNKQTKVLPWDLDHSAGNTFGCRVSDKGEFHLYHNGRNVGVAWEGLPIYEQLWGFVGMVGGKVEADYTSTKGETVMCGKCCAWCDVCLSTLSAVTCYVNYVIPKGEAV